MYFGNPVITFGYGSLIGISLPSQLNFCLVCQKNPHSSPSSNSITAPSSPRRTEPNKSTHNIARCRKTVSSQCTLRAVSCLLSTRLYSTGFGDSKKAIFICSIWHNSSYCSLLDPPTFKQIHTPKVHVVQGRGGGGGGWVDGFP